jgi:hypothetical protein
VFPVLIGRNTCIGWKLVLPIVSIRIASHIYAFNMRNLANTNGLVAYLANSLETMMKITLHNMAFLAFSLVNIDKVCSIDSALCER